MHHDRAAKEHELSKYIVFIYSSCLLSLSIVSIVSKYDCSLFEHARNSHLNVGFPGCIDAAHGFALRANLALQTICLFL